MTRGEVIAAYDRLLDLAGSPYSNTVRRDILTVIAALANAPVADLQAASDDVLRLFGQRLGRDPTLVFRIRGNIDVIQALRNALDVRAGLD